MRGQGTVAALAPLILTSPVLAQGISVTTNECQVRFRLAVESGNEIRQVTNRANGRRVWSDKRRLPNHPYLKGF